MPSAAERLAAGHARTEPCATAGARAGCRNSHQRLFLHKSSSRREQFQRSKSFSLLNLCYSSHSFLSISHIAAIAFLGSRGLEHQHLLSHLLQQTLNSLHPHSVEGPGALDSSLERLALDSAFLGSEAGSTLAPTSDGIGSEVVSPASSFADVLGVHFSGHEHVQQPATGRTDVSHVTSSQSDVGSRSVGLARCEGCQFSDHSGSPRGLAIP